MAAHCFDLSIRVLICREDDSFTAHALELDLVGQGETEDEATQDLADAVLNQLSFATQMKNPDLVAQKAPIEYFVRWEAAHDQALRGIANGDKAGKFQAKAVILPIEKPRAKGRAKFEPVPVLA